MTSDFAPYAPMLRGFEAIGVEPMRSPTVPEQQAEGLRKMTEDSGFTGTAVTHIEATQTFKDFDEFWNVQTLTVSPIGKAIAKLDDTNRARLREAMQSLVPVTGDGVISYSARAVAFMATT